MLPLLYPDPSTREAVLVDPQSAPIPELHRELFRFAERFVRGSWNSTQQDLEHLRRVGLADRDIVQWATLGSTQSWFTMSADGGGVPLEGDAFTGPGVGRPREDYETASEGLLAAAPDVAAPTRQDDETRVTWVETDESIEEYREAASWAEDRYGAVPNLLRAVSLQPGYYRRHCMALELLEAPQSRSLSARQHALVRVLVSYLNRSPYSATTSTALLEAAGGDPVQSERLREPIRADEWEPTDRVVLELASKLARNAYKVTEKDAISVREAGLDDEAYVDVLNTVAIQTAMDRLTNVLGVRPDPFPLIALS